MLGSWVNDFATMARRRARWLADFRRFAHRFPRSPVDRKSFVRRWKSVYGRIKLNTRMNATLTQAMKLKILVFTLFLGVCMASGQDSAVPASSGDTPATKEQGEKLFEVMDIRRQTRNMMGTVQQQMRAMTIETVQSRYPAITPAQMARLNRISDESLKNFPVDAMLDDMIPIYQKHLNHTDVDAMIVFYSSPTGKKLMQQLPQITQEAMQASYQRMQKQVDDVLRRVEEMVKEDEQQKKQPGSSTKPAPQSQQN
jgi:hypothetical protein